MNPDFASIYCLEFLSIASSYVHAANGTKKYGVVSPYPSTRGTSLSNVLTAAILAAGADGGPSVDIGKPMAIHKTTTRIKMDNKHQCCRRKWTPEKEKNQHCRISQPAHPPDTVFCFQDCWFLTASIALAVLSSTLSDFARL